MRKISVLFAPVLLICCLLACKKASKGDAVANSNYALIFGKWTLEKQHVIINVSSKTIDTTYTPSIDDRAEIQFNSDNSYVNTKYYPTGGGNFGQAALIGLYGFSGSAFSLSTDGIVGLRNGEPSFSDVVNTSIPNILTSYSITIDQLTTTNLNIHIAYLYSYNGGSQSYKAESDFYFNKY